MLRKIIIKILENKDNCLKGNLKETNTDEQSLCKSK